MRAGETSIEERLPPQATATALPGVAMAEWRRNWPMVIAAMVGFSLSTISFYTLGLFVEPLGREFGWSRAQISSGLPIYSMLLVPLAPLVGAAVDKWGSRRFALFGTLVVGIAFASFGLTNGSFAMWWAQWAIFTIASLGVHTAIFTTAVASRFENGRGLALAATLCGSSLAQVFAPVVTNQLIATFGWRWAYAYLGLGWGGLAFFLVLLFFHDRRSLVAKAMGTAEVLVQQGGLGVVEALRSLRLWRIALTELLTSTLVMSLVVHFVPMLTDKGVDRSVAAAAAGTVGILAIGGKLLTGFLLDRSQSSWIPTLSLWVPAIACVLLLQKGSVTATFFVAAGLFGYALGSYIQTVSYLASRYAGLRNFGKIFGLMASLMALGSGMGPVLAGRFFDVTGSYDLWLKICIALSIVAGLLVYRLGPYPAWETDPIERGEGTRV